VFFQVEFEWGLCRGLCEHLTDSEKQLHW